MKTLRSFRTILSIALIAGAVYLIVTRIIHDGPALKAGLLSYPARSIAGCTGLFLIVVFLESILWHETLKTMSDEASQIRFRESLRIFTLSNLGKYVPGRIWILFLQSLMLSQRQVPVKTTIAVNVVLAAYGALSALLVGCLCVLGLPLSFWVKAAAFVIGVCVLLVPIVLRMPVLRAWAGMVEKEKRYYWSKMAGFCAIWILHGYGAVFLASSYATGGWQTDVQIIGGMAVSWLVGAIALFTPAGLGVRETALYLSLSHMPEALRLSLPVLTRLCLLAAEVMLLAATLLGLAVRKAIPEK